jgi:hypothetical protein
MFRPSPTLTLRVFSRRGQRDDVARGAEVGAQRDAGAVAALADQALPLEADIGRVVRRHLDHQRFDVDLRTPRVQALDHGAQLALQRLGAGDDERVGRRIGLHETADRGRGRCGQRCCCRCGGAAGRRCWRRRWVRDRGQRRRRRATTERSTHHGGQLHGIGVLQRHHLDVAHRVVAGCRAVQAIDQRAHRGQARRVRDAQQQGVAARRGLHPVGRRRRCARRWCAGRTTAIDQPLHERQHLGRDGVTKLDHIHVAAGRQVERGDQRRDAHQVVGVVGDNQGAVAGAGVDRVVR